MITLKSTLTPIEILLQTILYRYFQSSYCIAFVSSESLRFDYNKTFVYIDSEGRNITDNLLEVSEIGCLDYIVRVKDPIDFIKAFDKVVHLGNTRKSDRKIVYLPGSYDDDVTGKLLKVLSMKETSFVPNVLIIAPSFNRSCESYDLITHKYVGLSNHSHPLYLDTWNSCTKQFYKNSNLFPHDMSNMFGKVVKVACFTYKPYVLLDLNTTIVPFGRDGIEVRIIEEFCRLVIN